MEVSLDLNKNFTNMLAGIPKISVVIITYNQETLIKRTIEALLLQKDYIYEICVSDDCSPDSTWEILIDYDRKYPGLFKLNRNEPNLGIFENIEKTWTMASGDLIYDQAGDDVVGPGWFKKVIDFIQQNNINIYENKICFLGDYKCVYPNGDSIVIKNNHARSNLNKLKLYERGIICNRSRIVSKKLYNSYISVSRGRSYVAENAQDCQVHIFSDSTYYISGIGNIYYASIGVSSHMSKERIQEHEQTMVYAFQFIKSLGIELDKNDLELPFYNIYRKRFLRNKNLRNFTKMAMAYIKCFDFAVCIRSVDTRRLLFRLIRRLPHRTPLNW